MGGVVAGIEQAEGDPGAAETAASGLRGTGGRLAATASTVAAATAATPSWSGRAALIFDDRCAD